MAATLLLPGAARDLAAARQAIPEALANLRVSSTRTSSIVATEKDSSKQEASGRTPAFAAAIDLLAEDKAAAQS